MKTKNFLLIMLVVIMIDQLSKLYFYHNFTHFEQWPLFPGLSFTLAFNEGAAFSFLAGQSGWQRWFFVVLAVGVSFFMWRLRRDYEHALTAQCALSLIIAGAIGNAIDRVWLGKVIDFIHAYTFWLEPAKSFPIFNVADIAITIGAGLLILQFVILDNQQQEISS